jgi:hypothetical protein
MTRSRNEIGETAPLRMRSGRILIIGASMTFVVREQPPNITTWFHPGVLSAPYRTRVTPTENFIQPSLARSSESPIPVKWHRSCQILWRVGSGTNGAVQE